MDRRWMDGRMDGWMRRWGGINRRSRMLCGCSRWRSSRCRGGEGSRIPSSAFYYDAPWQHGEWMCGRMYSLPISTSSAQSHLHSRLPSFSGEIETGGEGASILEVVAEPCHRGDGWMCSWTDVSEGSWAVPALVLMQHLSSYHTRVS